MKFIQFNKQLQTGALPVYLLEGEEVYFRDQAVRRLREEYVSQPQLNDVRLEGENLKGEKLSSFVSDLYALPFLSERRMIRVYEFYPTEKEYETYLKKYFENPSPSTLLVIVNGGKKKGGGAELKKKPNVTFVDCGKEEEEVLTRWALVRMKQSGLKANADAVQRFVRYCNNDCARMSKEIEKLAFLLGEGGEVTAEVVDEQIPKDVEYKIYELTQAASRRSFATFSEILSDLLKKGYDENALLASLASYYRSLYEVTEMKGSDGEIAKTLGVKPFAVQKNRETAFRMGRSKVKEYYLFLYGLAADMRSGLCSKEGALSAAIAKIFFE